MIDTRKKYLIGGGLIFLNIIFIITTILLFLQAYCKLKKDKSCDKEKQKGFGKGGIVMAIITVFIFMMTMAFFILFDKF